MKKGAALLFMAAAVALCAYTLDKRDIKAKRAYHNDVLTLFRQGLHDKHPATLIDLAGKAQGFINKNPNLTEQERYAANTLRQALRISPYREIVSYFQSVTLDSPELSSNDPQDLLKVVGKLGLYSDHLFELAPELLHTEKARRDEFKPVVCAWDACRISALRSLRQINSLSGTEGSYDRDAWRDDLIHSLTAAAFHTNTNVYAYGKVPYDTYKAREAKIRDAEKGAYWRCAMQELSYMREESFKVIARLPVDYSDDKLRDLKWNSKLEEVHYDNRYIPLAQSLLTPLNRWQKVRCCLKKAGVELPEEIDIKLRASLQDACIECTHHYPEERWELITSEGITKALRKAIGVGNEIEEFCKKTELEMRTNPSKHQKMASEKKPLQVSGMVPLSMLHHTCG